MVEHNALLPQALAVIADHDDRSSRRETIQQGPDNAVEVIDAGAVERLASLDLLGRGLRSAWQSHLPAQ